MRNPGLQSVAARRPAPDRRHAGLDPGLVDEGQPLRIEAALILLPLRPSTRCQDGAARLAERFLKLSPSDLQIGVVRQDRPISSWRPLRS